MPWRHNDLAGCVLFARIDKSNLHSAQSDGLFTQ